MLGLSLKEFLANGGILWEGTRLLPSCNYEVLFDCADPDFSRYGYVSTALL